MRELLEVWPTGLTLTKCCSLWFIFMWNYISNMQLWLSSTFPMTSWVICLLSLWLFWQYLNVSGLLLHVSHFFPLYSCYDSLAVCNLTWAAGSNNRFFQCGVVDKTRSECCQDKCQGTIILHCRCLDGLLKGSSMREYGLLLFFAPPRIIWVNANLFLIGVLLH